VAQPILALESMLDEFVDLKRFLWRTDGCVRAAKPW
jgi:hypothetical protein